MNFKPISELKGEMLNAQIKRAICNVYDARKWRGISSGRQKMKAERWLKRCRNILKKLRRTLNDSV